MYMKIGLPKTKPLFTNVHVEIVEKGKVVIRIGENCKIATEVGLFASIDV